MKKKEVFPTESVQFNGIELICVCTPNQTFIAVKPLCSALEVNYNRQYQNIQKDPILGPVFAKQQIQVQGDQVREYMCLPEKYIYGYLFQISSNSKKLLEYRQQVYDLLFDHFHGVLGERRAILRDKKSVDYLLKELKNEVSQDPRVQQINELEKKKRQLQGELRNQDNKLTGLQGDIFDTGK